MRSFISLLFLFTLVSPAFAQTHTDNPLDVTVTYSAEDKANHERNLGGALEGDALKEYLRKKANGEVDFICDAKLAAAKAANPGQTCSVAQLQRVEEFSNNEAGELQCNVKVNCRVTCAPAGGRGGGRRPQGGGVIRRGGGMLYVLEVQEGSTIENSLGEALEFILDSGLTLENLVISESDLTCEEEDAVQAFEAYLEELSSRDVKQARPINLE
ncbi:MAG: hypothetical protein KDD70_16765 [Bdellovibrionales bacterium]|nr:hypothetical protein [Bdellovibrionales bacterium]